MTVYGYRWEKIDFEHYWDLKGYSIIRIVDQSMKSVEQIFPIIHCISILDWG